MVGLVLQKEVTYWTSVETTGLEGESPCKKQPNSKVMHFIIYPIYLICSFLTGCQSFENQLRKKNINPAQIVQEMFKTLDKTRMVDSQVLNLWNVPSYYPMLLNY